MGNQASTPIDESIPPETLESRTIEAVAKYVQEGRAKNIVVLVSCSQFSIEALSDCLFDSAGLALVHPLEFRISVPQTPVFMLNSANSTCHIRKRFLISLFFAIILYLSTSSHTNCILATISPPYPIFSCVCCRKRVYF